MIEFEWLFPTEIIKYPDDCSVGTIPGHMNHMRNVLPSLLETVALEQRLHLVNSSA
jgi:hypothetical protein